MMFGGRKYFGRFQTVTLTPVKEVPVLIPHNGSHYFNIFPLQQVVSPLTALDQTANHCSLDIFQGDLFHIFFARSWGDQELLVLVVDGIQ